MDDILSNLEKRVKKLEKKRKDRWDKFQILSSILIPAAITISGIIISNSMRTTELEQVKIIEKSKKDLQDLQLKLNQSNLIAVFMENLTDSSKVKRALSIGAIEHALDSTISTTLLKVISESEKNAEIRKLAKNKLEDINTRDLIPLVFSNVISTSDSATTEFIKLGATHQTTLIKLITACLEEGRSKHSLINALTIIINYGTYRGETSKRVFEYFFKNFNNTDPEIMILINELNQVYNADQNGKPRPQTPVATKRFTEMSSL